MMEQFTAFFEKLNEITKQTGIVIDTFGDQFYDPSLVTEATFGERQVDERIYFSYDTEQQTYVGRLGNPYDGDIVFPANYNDK